jgi:hypothetical protein
MDKVIGRMKDFNLLCGSQTINSRIKGSLQKEVSAREFKLSEFDERFYKSSSAHFC